jgi:hypothetical protein
MKQARCTHSLIRLVSCLVLLFMAGATTALAQETTWMTAGSLHNWFSSMGCEIEVGRAAGADQQDGLQWPAWYKYQDAQAAKGFWIGTTNFTDASNINWLYKVDHVGPRVRGTGEFVPVTFEMVSKYAPPSVTVNGGVTEGKSVDVARVDPTLAADRMLLNVVNTSIGITMTRKILQFSQQYHDNYMIYDYTFTNTGNTDADPEIELPNKTLTGVYFYWQYRYAPCADTRYVIGNGTSWGMNTMNDVRGDGFILPTTGNTDVDDAVDIPGIYTAPHMRAQFVWHGKFSTTTVAYDNLGGPIWVPYYDKTDTTGRIGAPQFVGRVTLHADKSATDKSDDMSQPSTTSFEGSDEDLTSGNSEFNDTKMMNEYTGWMTRGHYKRHAWVVEPQGKFDEPIGNPSFNDEHAKSGSGGGFSNAEGYGPYTLAPGQSVHIVVAEGAAGLSRERCIAIGRAFKAATYGPTAPGGSGAKAKNDSVLTGKDSLFQTFRRALGNYKSGYAIPPAPQPPSAFAVSNGDPVSMTWEVASATDPNMKGFKIYRAIGRYDGDYQLIHVAGPTERTYLDATAARGQANYYYIVTIGDPALNTGQGLTPRDTLYSNRIYTQTYTAAYFKAKYPAGQSMDSIRIVPNPFVLSANSKTLRFDGEPDKIAFYNIPGQCHISIYTELGELVYEINHTDGSGDEYWKSITSSRQVVVSGIYIAVFENLDNGERRIKKFAVIR